MYHLASSLYVMINPIFCFFQFFVAFRHMTIFVLWTFFNFALVTFAFVCALLSVKLDGIGPILCVSFVYSIEFGVSSELAEKALYTFVFRLKSESCRVDRLFEVLSTADTEKPSLGTVGSKFFSLELSFIFSFCPLSTLSLSELKAESPLAFL